MDDDPWLVTLKAVDSPSARLFCFPYAGGSATIYRPWADLLQGALELAAAQLPGHGNRLAEAPETNLDQIVDELVSSIEPRTDVPFAFYGHSMGALIAFEVACRMWDEFRLGPAHLFVGARRAPNRRARDEELHLRPSEKIVSFLKGLSSAPGVVWDNKELMDAFLPALRADLEIDTSYRHTPGRTVSCPITAFTGESDDYVGRDEVADWALHTGGACQVRVMTGNHFFMDHPQHRLPLLQALQSELSHYFD